MDGASDLALRLAQRVAQGTLSASAAPCRRTHAGISINDRRAMHRFDNANSVTSCAVLLASPL